MKFIAEQQAQWGIEPICRALQVAPSTYYTAPTRPASPRDQHDARLKVAITRVHEQNFGVHGVEKVWRQLLREGEAVGREALGGSCAHWASPVSFAVSVSGQRFG